jgi:hypothetical protein
MRVSGSVGANGPSRALGAERNTMHDAHRKAAEHNEKGDDEGGIWHSGRALEHSVHAYKLVQEAHTKSGQIVSL